ncbi:MAG: hypothetical protein NVS4B9_17830 [Ktedonobacteraceae bacterium]
MSQLHSRQPVNSDEAERTRARAHSEYDEYDTYSKYTVHNASTLVPLATWDVETDLYTDKFPVPMARQSRQDSGKLFTEPLASVSAPLYDTRATQSLVIALQSTLQPQTGKTPLVIPGSRQKTRQTSQMEKLPAARRLHPSIRLGVILIATCGILLFTLSSLSPLGKDRGGTTLFDGAIQWAQEQGGAWNGMVSRIQQAAQPAAPDANTTVAAPPAAPNLPAVANLPRGAYVDVARQAAIRYGISPDNFVRQIQQESHFNPNALSPSGAVGIAQFLPSTAASLGVNPYDPVSALNGAARFMASLAGQFGGDYAKALAAYNAGPGAVQSAVNMGGAAWLTYLPAETQNYVRIIMG